MQELFQRQKIIAESIDKILINFRKDSASRKTRDYAQRRMEALEQLWQEFEVNDKRLLTLDDRTDNYFVLNVYQTLNNKYQTFRTELLKIIQGEGSSSANDNGGMSKSDELLSLQSTNFRALLRLTRNLNISALTEKWEIEDKIQTLQSRWKAIDEIHWQIDTLLIGSDIDYEQEFTKYENIYESTKRELNCKLNTSSQQQRALPPIDIPTFSGDYNLWPTFMDLYCEAIHNNTMLNKAQKMQHLKGKLKGEAERIVQHLTVSADNYDTCWDILTTRYNNKQLLFTKQIQTFVDQPSIHQQSSSELKRLHDTSLETIHAIHNLGVDTTTWDPILVHILAGKLDSETYTAYMETRATPRELPSFDEFITFIQRKFMALEPINKKRQPTFNLKPKISSMEFSSTSQKDSHYNNAPKRNYARTYHVNAERTCPLCKCNHFLLYCDSFKQMSSQMKLKTMVRLDVCCNCMYSHNGQKCPSRKRCRVCNSAHHTSIHDMIRETKPPAIAAPTSNTMPCKPKTPPTLPVSSPPVPSPRKSNHVAGSCTEVLLATVMLKVKAADGTYLQLRGLLDQGSQINLISESAVQRLGLPRRHQNATVSGIGLSANQCNGTVQLNCSSLFGNSEYSFTTEALVMPRMLSSLPNNTFENKQWSHLHNINLADPDFNISRPVDILLDAGIYASIVMAGVLRGPKEAPIAQQTKLGWVVLGNVKTYNCHAVINDVESIARFWEMEEVSTEHPVTPETEYCETMYSNTTQRLSDGRYVVKIPMKPNFERHLGASKPKAVAQFHQLGKRLMKNKILAGDYKNFIEEYLHLGHMKPSITSWDPHCFLPHHGVLKLDSTTTKLRVVFNASAKTSSGLSLNDLMECGPNLQQDLQQIILKWRTYQFVYTADIEKFYRQILVHEEDQHLQKILWRDSATGHIADYQLCTITYGTKAAPFLAMRTIQQLVKDDGHHYPLAADILKNQLYVDDLLGGSNTVIQGREAQHQLINLLKGGCFNLRKWASNNPILLKHLPKELISLNMIDFKHAETNKTLGVKWNPCTDNFTFQQDIWQNYDVTTKRQLLSDISKLYDPLGWLAPATVKAKLIFQQTWLTNKNWDEPVPDLIRKEWTQFRHELPLINNIQISRWIGDTTKPIELHGFCDASERAYGCVIYCKSTNQEGQPVIKLVTAKTKLAPLQKPISLPKLELCAALLLSRLMKRTIDAMNIQIRHSNIYGWTDSMVVLGWLNGSPMRWKTFVSNRVTKITEEMPKDCWRHVRSEENPADCSSRGLTPSQLTSHPLWWEGPDWLKSKDLPKQLIYSTTEEERKIKLAFTTQKNTTLIETLLQNYNSMSRVIRVLSWVMRFATNARDIKSAKRISYLTTSDLEAAHNKVIQAAQHSNFAADIINLQKRARVLSSSNILNLNPYFDENKIMRVGGRLKHANLKPPQKHPIILPKDSKVTELLIDQAHKMTLHGGARLTLNYLRTRYWVIGGMQTVKKRLLRCVRCHRFKTSSNNQIMADLPSPRVTPSRPFTHTGVDFTGHVEVKTNKGRGVRTTKGYIAVFVCLSTKAIHLELVSDLSTETFLAALKRLCARRGLPKHLYSDNGTNFVGAARTLNKQHKEAMLHYINSDFLTTVSEAGIEWHFNAPSWPTAGGLWEAAVKSMKHHLKRVIGEQKLTFEQFSTLLTQIEACLNSRPLVALTNDIDDLDCLTPGHFLVGGPVLAPPVDSDDFSGNLCVKWRLIEKMYKDFWRRWSVEYLQALQNRSKWQYPSKNIEKGDVVLVKDDLAPPARWLLARVTETHPGADGLVRVVTIKTRSNYMKRPITKLSRLPIEQDKNEGKNDSTNNEPDNPKRRLRPRPALGTFVSYLFALLTLVAIAVTPSMQQPQLVNITSLSPAKLFYFDKIKDMQIIQDEWKMVVYYNMSSYWRSLANVETYITHLNSLCKEEAAFKTIASQFEHELKELKHYNDMLKLEHSPRIKRGLIDGVGYIAHSLFGVLDERFAEKYHKDIKMVQDNQGHLLNLYKEHTSLIEGEYNLLKRNEDVMNAQFSIISKHLSEIESKIAHDQQSTIYITSTALAANMVISNLRRVQQLLIDLVSDVKNGRVDAHLLKPDEFEKQLNIISGQIPQDLSLPCINRFGCTQLMYKLSKVHVKITQEFMIFEVKIPLINSEIYELTSVIPIPNIQGHTTTRITPTSDYLAVNLQEDLMIPLSANDLTSCVDFNEHQVLCKLNMPIYNIKPANDYCEAQIMNNETPSRCRSTVLDCKDDWIVLHGQRSWLYTCCKECTVRIFCAAGVTSKILQNTGILTLSEGCVLRGEHHVIHARNKFRSEMTVTDEQMYIPESGINHFINTDHNFTFNPEHHEEQVATLKEHIEHVKKQQEFLLQQADTSDSHHYVMYGLLVGCMAIVIIFAITKFRSHLRRYYSTELEMISTRQVEAEATSTSATQAAGSHSHTRTESAGNLVRDLDRGRGAAVRTVDRANSPVTGYV